MKPSEMSILIAGAGIAGLTAAIAARRLGFSVQLFEQADEFRDLGGGLALQSNGQRVLAALDLLDSLEECFRATQTLLLERPGGNVLSEFDYRALSVPYSRFAVILRRDLHRHLLQAAERLGISVRFGHRAEALASAGAESRVSFANGSAASAHVVIGADGTHSRIRDSSGISCHLLRPREAYLRAAAAAAADDDFVHEIWSPDGRRFGYAPLPSRQTYFYCTAPFRQWPPQSGAALQHWIDSWADFGPLAMRLLRAVPNWSEVNCSEIVEVEMDRWSRPPVFLIGDAAHAMTPNLGQGANSAMVDALVLVRLLAQEDSLVAVAERYHRLRFHFVRRLQHASRRVGALAATKNPLLRTVSDAGLRFASSFPGLTAGQRFLTAGWNPPENALLAPL
jgi:2-polyprenyl-6-methoxyphenol hydroxylase-like FAD-dependent oxidoreductase